MLVAKSDKSHLKFVYIKIS